MITIAMVHKPIDSSQHMWSINTAVFPIIYEASKCWPGVKAYRLTEQEKYYEPTLEYKRGKDSTGLEQVIQAAPNVKLTLQEEGYEIRTPEPQDMVGDTPSPEATRHKPLTSIDLRLKV